MEKNKNEILKLIEGYEKELVYAYSLYPSPIDYIKDTNKEIQKLKNQLKNKTKLNK